MTDIEKALIYYDGNNDMPYCDLVWQALKEMQEREPKLIKVDDLLNYIDKYVWIVFADTIFTDSYLVCDGWVKSLHNSNTYSFNFITEQHGKIYNHK